MSLFLAGLDHTTAHVDIRERLAFNPTDIAAALLQLTTPQGDRAPIFAEAVIVSTCNRVEIYGVTADASTAHEVVRFLADFHDLDEEDFVSSLFFYHDADVVQHLCATAAGLRSLILGEAQIQGQVRSSYDAAQRAGSVGPILNRLFRQALTTGKRVRHETALGLGAASVSQAGVALARKRLGCLEGRSVLLVGSGEVSELAAQNLIANGADHLMIVNRTRSRSEELAERYGAEVFEFDELPQLLSKADIVISSTAAPVTLIYRNHVADALADKTLRSIVEGGPPPSMLLLDLAVPRDIAADAGDLPGVHLCTVDDLNEVVEHTMEQRQALVFTAQQIVVEEVTAFVDWLRSQDAVPALSSLRRHAEALRCAEVSRALRQLATLSPEEQHVVEALSRSIVNKLLHTPTRRIKDAAAHGEGQRYAAMLCDLFNLEPAA